MALQALASLSDGTQAPVTEGVTWSAADPAVASISAQGLVLTHAVGKTDIHAALGELTATTTVSVTRELRSLDIVTADGTALAPILVGQDLELRAVGTYSDGHTAELTSAEGLAWRSSDPTVATISADGRVETHAVGQTDIHASRGALSATVSVSVTRELRSLEIVTADGTEFAPVPVGLGVGLRALGTYSDDATEDLTAEVQWGSADPTIATVASGDDPPGTVKAHAAGTTTISVSLDGVTGSRALEVGPAVLVEVLIDGGDIIRAPGRKLRLSATGVLSDGTRGPVSGVTWFLRDGSGGSLGYDGEVTVGGPIGTQMEIVGVHHATGLSATVQIHVRRYVYASTNRRGPLAEQEVTPLQGIQGFTADDGTGALTEIPNGLVTLADNHLAYGGAIHPSGWFVYFVTSAPHAQAGTYGLGGHDSGRLEVFRVDVESGRLLPVQSVQLDGAGSDVAMSADGRYLVTITNRATEGGEVRLFRVDQDTGEVVEISRRSNIGGVAPAPLRQVNVHPKEPYVYVACNDAGSPASGVYAMRYGEEGLTPIPGVDPYFHSHRPHLSAPEGVVARHWGDFVLTTHQAGTTGWVGSFMVLSQTGTFFNPTDTNVANAQVGRMAISPGGLNLYVASTELRVFPVSQGYGEPAPGTKSEAPTAAPSRDLEVEATGRFLYLARAHLPTEAPGELVTFTVHPNGWVTPLQRLPISAFGVVTSP